MPRRRLDRAQYPVDEGSLRDEDEFYAPPGPLPTVKESAAAYNPSLPGGDVLDPLVDYEPGEHFGPVVYVEPRQRVTVMGEEGGDGAEVTEQDKWQRFPLPGRSNICGKAEFRRKGNVRSCATPVYAGIQLVRASWPRAPATIRSFSLGRIKQAWCGIVNELCASCPTPKGLCAENCRSRVEATAALR